MPPDRRLAAQVDPAIGVSVNVSGRQVGNPIFPAQVAAIAERHGLRAGTLALEITETVLMEEADSPATVIDAFAEHGITLALDDFGTGYSSLSRLKRFPPRRPQDRPLVRRRASNATSTIARSSRRRSTWLTPSA